MRGTDQDGQLLGEGTRHLIYRGPLRIGEIEETTAVRDIGRDYGFRIGLTATCLRDPERRYPTALLDKRFRTVASALKAIKQAEQQWWNSLLTCEPAGRRNEVRRNKVANKNEAGRDCAHPGRCCGGDPR